MIQADHNSPIIHNDNYCVFCVNHHQHESFLKEIQCLKVSYEVLNVFKRWGRIESRRYLNLPT